MGLVYDQFAQELESLQRKYADRPRDELIALCLMALEREELVTVGYREDLMNRRLESMPLNEPVRELIRHALIWAWRDESASRSDSGSGALDGPVSRGTGECANLSLSRDFRCWVS